MFAAVIVEQDETLPFFPRRTLLEFWSFRVVRWDTVFKTSNRLQQKISRHFLLGLILWSQACLFVRTVCFLLIFFKTSAVIFILWKLYSAFARVTPAFLA